MDFFFFLFLTSFKIEIIRLILKENDTSRFVLLLLCLLNDI